LRATRATGTGVFSKAGALSTAGTLTTAIATAAVALGTACAGALAAQSGSRHGTATASVASAARVLGSHHMRLAAARSSIVVDRDQYASPTGRIVVVHGLLRPGRRGAEVKLMTRAEHRWRTLAVGRTRRNGRFGIRYRVRGQGATWVRVRFNGSRRARSASAAAGKIVPLAPTVASWYEDAGSTACGFHATYGVANRTLPCGTRVTLSYGDRTIVATVDDRGPFVYGRSFDLNQNTARYLDMWGVATVFASL
jgi:hypothetical protein